MYISPMDLATYYGVDDIPAALSIGDNLHSLNRPQFPRHLTALK